MPGRPGCRGGGASEVARPRFTLEGDGELEERGVPGKEVIDGDGDGGGK